VFHDQGSAVIMMAHSTGPVYATYNVQVLACLFTTVRREIGQSPSEPGAQSREAGATSHTGVPKGECPLHGDSTRGLARCKSGRGRLQSRVYDWRKANLKQYVDRPSAL
jgi:hypothetical protein